MSIVDIWPKAVQRTVTPLEDFSETEGFFSVSQVDNLWWIFLFESVPVKKLCKIIVVMPPSFSKAKIPPSHLLPLYLCCLLCASFIWSPHSRVHQM